MSVVYGVWEHSERFGDILLSAFRFEDEAMRYRNHVNSEEQGRITVSVGQIAVLDQASDALAGTEVAL